MPDDRCIFYRAAWVCPVDQPAIPNGYVQACNHRIAAVGSWNSKTCTDTSTGSVVDLGDVAIIPSLVNAHTHLEFSDLEKPLGQAGIEFTQWIRKVIDYRRECGSNSHTKKKAIQRGIKESIAAGVGLIGEIATFPLDLDDYKIGEPNNAPQGLPEIDLTIFYEQLSRQPSRFNHSVFAVDTLLTAHRQQKAFGISPHAPYSVHPMLLQMLITAANRHHVPVAMHLAETEAERELLENRSGPFVQLLQGLSVWNERSFYPRSSILDYLQRLSTAGRSLVVHGNYLRENEIEWISRHRERMSVVYCPRTHRFFRHSPYPLSGLLESGICVAVGTDSRASNPDLNLFAELQLISREFPELNSCQILKLGTLNGAQALGASDRLGSLTIGKRARLSYITSAQVSPHTLDWIFDPGSCCKHLDNHA